MANNLFSKVTKLFKGSPVASIQQREIVIDEAGAKAQQINPGNLKQFMVKVIGIISSQGAGRGNDFSPPEYDLADIKAAADTDSYVKAAFQKYAYLIYKAGYSLKSNNEQALDYIKSRFRIMALSTRVPIDILAQEMADDLVKYSNAFALKSRVDNIQWGIQAKGVFGPKPVGGYFRADPSCMQIKRDAAGNITGYKLKVGSTEKTFKPEDVIHWYIDREAGEAFGKPRVIAALEDVKLLRKIEGNVISLIYRYAIPLYHWKLGIPESGMQATDKEINDAKLEVERVANDGIIITNERTTIAAIGAEGEALDASKYLQYFEKRVFTALGVSESQMGRGGAKKDADSMEQQVHAIVKYIQRTISIFFEHTIILELLLEGGYNPIANPDDMVTYEFEEINLDTKIKLENHEVFKYQSDLSTSEESRRKMGMKDTPDEQRLHSNMITQKNALEQISAKSGDAATSKPVSSKPNGGVTAKNRPSNQHGTTSVKVKESSNNDTVSSEYSEIRNLSEKIADEAMKKLVRASNDICSHGESPAIIMSITRDSIVKVLTSGVEMAIIKGSHAAQRTAGKSIGSHHKIVVSPLQNAMNKAINSLCDDIQKECRKDKENQQAVFNALSYRLRFITHYWLPKAYWFSYVKTCKDLGIEKVRIVFHGSKDKEDHDSVVNTSSFDMDQIPAYHSYCDCEVHPISSVS